MLTVGKPARRPETFRRLTGVDTDTFYKIAELIRPLWEERRDNFGEGGREHSLQGHENHLPAMLLYYRCYVTDVTPSRHTDESQYPEYTENTGFLLTQE